MTSTRPGKERSLALAKMRLHMDGLTPKLRSVVEFMIERPEDTTMMSVEELASAAQVSVATIYRLCRDLGYQTFSRLKLAIAQELSANAALQEDGPTDRHGSNDYLRAIEETAGLLDEPDVRAAAKLIGHARRILTIGLGASATGAAFLKFKLLRAGLRCEQPTDMHLATMLAATGTKDDLVIAFSASGGTRDVIDLLTVAREAESSIIGITGRRRNPVAELSQFHFIASASDNPITSGSGASIVSQIAVADILYRELYSQSPSIRRRIDRATESVISKHV